MTLDKEGQVMLMRTLTHKRSLWFATIVGIVVLLVGGSLFLGWEHLPLGGNQTTRSSMNAPVEPEPDRVHETPMAPSHTMAPAQAYAMMAPMQQQLIGVKTMLVEERPMETVVRAVGRVDYNEQRVTHVNVRISGWVEELFVDYTGQAVQSGQPLFTLYSPDLVTTQDEYLLALRARERVNESPLPVVHEQANQLVEAARDRLRFWTMTEGQIDNLAKQKKAQTYVTIYSPVSGYVIEKTVFKGTFVQPDIRLYTIADLSVVWMNAEIYEYETPLVEVGQTATITFASYPGEQFHGRVSYIYPYVNKEARTVKVRLDLPNPDIRIKPDMYGDVLVNVDRGNKVTIPEQAVLDSGKQTLVFVVRGEGVFEPRPVKLGPRIGSYYEVREGVMEGDRVVTSGNFLIDSESKLMASTNMMGALGMGGVKMEQALMGEMDMGGPQTKAATPTAASEREQKVGGLTIMLSTNPSPPRIGENSVRVTVTDKNGQPLSVANIQLTYTMPMPGMSPATIPMVSTTEGTYAATANFGMGGQWDLTVTIRRAGQPDVQSLFTVKPGGGMPGMQGM